MNIMNNYTRIAIFDFCETLVSFQTANPYIDYICESKGGIRNLLYKTYKFVNRTKIISLIYRLIIGHGSGKRLPALFTTGITKEEMEKLAESYYINKIRPFIIWPIIDVLKTRRKEGYELFIISGGYDIYINFFANEFNIDHVIANKFIFKSNICSGKYESECMNENKVKLFYKEFNYKNYDLSKSFVYTDSITDMPLLLMVDNRVVVSRNKHQKWATSENGITQEIIW